MTCDGCDSYCKIYLYTDILFIILFIDLCKVHRVIVAIDPRHNIHGRPCTWGTSHLETNKDDCV